MVQKPSASGIDFLFGAEEGDFIVEGIAFPGKKEGGDVKDIFEKKRRGNFIPSGIASRLMSGSQAARSK